MACKQVWLFRIGRITLGQYIHVNLGGGNVWSNEYLKVLLQKPELLLMTFCHDKCHNEAYERTTEFFYSYSSYPLIKKSKTKTKKVSKSDQKLKITVL